MIVEVFLNGLLNNQFVVVSVDAHLKVTSCAEAADKVNNGLIQLAD